MAEAHPEIVAERLHKTFGKQEVLRGISLKILAGDLVAIVGGSGSGKTVLLNHLIGLLQPDKGRVLAADHDAVGRGGGGGGGQAPPLVDLAEIDEDHLDGIRLHWAVVFQMNALFTGTVEENVSLWLREHTDMSPRDIRQRVRDSLKAVALDVDSVLAKDRAQLSGGMAKRVAIARAIAVEPIVIFYDEPTTGLDPVVGGQVHELIWDTHHRPREDGVPRTTVVVTHDKELLRRIRPRVVMMDKGKVVFEGSYEEFEESGVEEAKAYLAAMPVLQARHWEESEGRSPTV
jgi:phospholipid/cholesterol/gamma-HCH transport system ATP-binding protein